MMEGGKGKEKKGGRQRGREGEKWRGWEGGGKVAREGEGGKGGREEKKRSRYPGVVSIFLSIPWELYI